MHTTSGSGATGADAAELSALFEDLKSSERAPASAVRRAGRLAGSGVAERVEGGSLDWAISMVCRWTGCDARTVVGAGEMLRHLPTVDRLFAEGLVSWGQVRRITAAARRLNADQRALLDSRVAAAVDAYSGIDAFDPDHLCDSIDDAATELRDPRATRRSEQAAARGNFLAIQGRLDGGSTGYWSGDALGSAPILDALTAARPVPQATPDGERAEGTPTRQGLQAFNALRDIAAEYLAAHNSGLIPDPSSAAAGDPDAAEPCDSSVADSAPGGASAGGTSGETRTRHPWLGRRRPARPLFTIALDLSQFSVSPSGVIELNVPGKLPRISAAAMEILARDADFRAVIFDGARPLAVSRKISAADIPADTRVAVRARDGADRWPGSRAPIGWTEPHHIVWRSRGGTHHPDNVVSLTRRNHRRVHTGGWQLSLLSDTGEVRITRRHRTWRSLPRGTGLPPPPEPC